jgi:L-ascorbate metabolism protein UlaG (beta-lactamase superfamily)
MASRKLKVGAVLLVLSPLLLVPAFFLYARHVPYALEARDRIPPALAQPQGGLSIRYLGVSGYELSDGKTVVLLDPTPTRPPPFELLSGPIDADPALGEKWCPRADFILVNHAHFDHVLDVPAIATRTGAKILGSQSTVNYALARGVPADKTQVVKPGDHLTLGTFTVDVRRSRHTAIGFSKEPMFGTIPADAKALWFWQYTIDDTLFFRLEANGSSVWFHPTSTYADKELSGPPAQALIVGVTGEPPTNEKLTGLIGEAKPKVILPTHYDNFFQPMDRGMGLMPMLDFQKTRAIFMEHAPQASWVVLDYGETLHLPPD